MKSLTASTLALTGLAALAFGCSSDDDASSSTSTTTAHFYLTDAPTDIQDAEKIEVAVCELSVHYVANGAAAADGAVDAAAAADAGADAGESDAGPHFESTGWITIFEEERVFDLLTLTNDRRAVLGESTFEPGKITQVRFRLCESTAPTITLRGDPTPKTMDVPQSAYQVGLKLVGQIELTGEPDIDVVIDFDAAASVKANHDGSYSMKPTIKLL